MTALPEVAAQCRQGGYALRASIGRHAECGTVFAAEPR